MSLTTSFQRFSATMDSKVTTPPAGETPPAAAGSPDWRDREIKRKHAQLQEEKRQRVELQASLDAASEMLKRLQEPDGATPAAGAAPAARRESAATPASNEDAIKAAATRMVAQQNFDSAANTADTTGKERYKTEWDKVTSTLTTLGGFDVDTMQGILATDDPAKVLYELGTKPEQYQRIMDLPPARRLADMVKLGLPEPKVAKRPSDAAEPIEPVGGRNRGDPTALSDELDDDAWYARRKKQKDARFKARQAGA